MPAYPKGATKKLPGSAMGMKIKGSGGIIEKASGPDSAAKKASPVERALK